MGEGEVLLWSRMGTGKVRPSRAANRRQRRGGRTKGTKGTKVTKARRHEEMEGAISDSVQLWRGTSSPSETVNSNCHGFSRTVRVELVAGCVQP